MSSSNTTCYNEDGTIASGDYLCDFPNLSTCCGSGWDCLSNGLCRQHGTTSYAQGTCTDPSYGHCLSFCDQSQFDGFTEVSRCEADGNSWCCAGAAGQGLGGTNCCDTSLTTSLEPYPFSTVDSSAQSTTASSDGSSALPSTTLTASIPGSSITSALSASSSVLSLGTSVQSTSRTAFATSTQVSATQTKTSTSSSSPQLDAQRSNSKTGIEVGIPVAVVVVLLAILAFFIFQNRKFRQRLLQLRGQSGEDLTGGGGSRNEMQERWGAPMGELDATHYELTHQDAPKHELFGNQIHELPYNSVHEPELVGDSPPR